MSDTKLPDKISQENEIENYSRGSELSWKRFSQWIHCICVVTFDLELGQALENVYPKHVSLTKQEISNICYLAFPDSNSGCMGDTDFVIRLPKCTSKLDLSHDHQKYNTICPVALQINAAFYWGFVYFRQVKDASLPRGYFQKSVVILSRLPFNNLFSKISCLISPEYFENGEPSLEAACHNINKWPSPVPGETLSLPLMGSVFQVRIPIQNNSAVARQFSSSNKDSGVSFENQVQITSVEELNLFEILQPVLSHIHLLWELVLTSEPLVVMASSPTNCSLMVLALTRIISPLKFCADYRPYFTIHDSEFKQFTSKARNPPPVILGVTNPFFAKTLHHWPHTIRLGEESGQSQKYKLKKNGNLKMLDINPGVYTTYKTFLHKDKSVIKNLLGINSKRPPEVQSALLKRHLLELTQSFMIPLERYIASLMPLLRNISPYKAAPPPLPFNPDNFFATLETTGPQLTSGIKGDWVGLYRKFFRSPNFNGWFDMRYTELALKLQALQLEALSDADMKLWVQGKPEVEIVDMVLKIKNKLIKCRECDIPISDATRDQLRQRLQDILGSLPDDVKNILQVT